MSTPDERYYKIKALRDDESAPEGERLAAGAALARHVEKHGEPLEPEPEPEVSPYARHKVGSRPYARAQWWRFERSFGDIGRGYTPDAEVVLMDCVTTRKEHKCIGCRRDYPKGARMWRPIAYNGYSRMHRLCCECFGPDPKAPPPAEQLE